MGRSSGGGYPAQGGYHHQCKSLKIFNHLLWLEEEAHPVVGVTNSCSHLWQRHNGPIMYNLACLQHMVWGLACFLHTMLLPNLPVTLHTLNAQVYFAVFGFTLLLCKKKKTFTHLPFHG